MPATEIRSGIMFRVPYHRFVALGDSFTEGVGDPAAHLPNGCRGWADRIAEVLAARSESFGYANLAIRGRKLPQIIARQLEPALAMKPDLVAIHGGGNDLLRPRFDLVALAVGYDNAVARLVDSGATVVLYTIGDNGHATFRPLRPRVQRFNDIVRRIVERRGAKLVDVWYFDDIATEQMLDVDRLHLNPPGHQHVAIETLNTLGVDHDLQRLPHAGPPDHSWLMGELKWMRAHALPWMGRQLSGHAHKSELTPKYPSLVSPPVM